MMDIGEVQVGQQVRIAPHSNGGYYAMGFCLNQTETAERLAQLRGTVVVISMGAVGVDFGAQAQTTQIGFGRLVTDGHSLPSPTGYWFTATELELAEREDVMEQEQPYPQNQQVEQVEPVEQVGQEGQAAVQHEPVQFQLGQQVKLRLTGDGYYYAWRVNIGSVGTASLDQLVGEIVLIDQIGRIGVDFGPTIAGVRLNTAVFHDLARRLRTSTGLYMHPDEIMPAVAGAAGSAGSADNPAISVPSTRLRVTIIKNPGLDDGCTGNYYDRQRWLLHISNGPVTGIQASSIQPYLSATDRRKVKPSFWERYSLEAVVSLLIVAGVHPDVLVAAVEKAVINKMALDSQGVFSSRDIVDDADLDRLVATEPPLMAIGNKLFSLQAVGVVDASRGMALIRQRVLAKSKEQSKQLIIAAKAEASGIVQIAQERVERLKVELARMQIDARAKVPQWVLDNQLPIKRVARGDNCYWMLGFNISLHIADIVMTVGRGGDRDGQVYHWTPIEIGNTMARQLMLGDGLQLWLPIDLQSGNYVYNGISDGVRAAAMVQLPHISTRGCCMNLQGMPPLVNDMRSYRNFIAAMDRGNSFINLSSLLVKHMEYWHPAIVAQLPDQVKQIIDAGCVVPAGMVLGGAGVQQVEEADEAAETFTIDSLGGD